jgi:hypothetical protein
MIIWMLGLALAGGGVSAPRVFSVGDYGAVADGRTDCRQAVNAAIQAAIASGQPAEVRFGPGDYRMTGTGRGTYCMPIGQARNLTIRGAGPRTRLMVSSPDAGVFLIMAGRNVRLQDLSMDYDPAPFTQGVVKAISVEEGWFDLEIEPGYTTPDAPNFVNADEPYGKWGMILDPATRRIRTGTPDHYMTPRWEARGGRVWRFFTPQEHYRLGLRAMKVGDRYVHLARGYASAILAQGCDGIAIENVTVHASPGLAVGLVGNRGTIRVRNLQVRFPKGSNRLLTTNADGVHCQQNRSGPIIEDCYFEGMADDAINIYAPPNTLLEKRGDKEWLVSPNCAILPGDRLAVLDPQRGIVRGTVQALTVVPEGRSLKIGLDRSIAGAVAGPDHRSADTLYNLSACGAGFRILRNHMNGNRRYGCLIRAGDGLIEGNVFADTTGAGVTLLNEPDWPEGPMPWNVTVRKNQFVRGGTCLGYADGSHGALHIRAAKLGFGLGETPGVRDIVIEQNEFVDCLGPAINAGGVDGLRISNNRFTGSATPLLHESPVMVLYRTRHAAIEANTIKDRRSGVLAGIVIQPDVEPGETGIVVRNNKAELPQDRSLVDDRRPKPGER